VIQVQNCGVPDRADVGDWRNTVLEPKRIVAVTGAVVLAVMLATAGCSKSSTREAGEKLQDEIVKAQQLCDRATALMANPVFVDTEDGQPVPLSRKVRHPDKMTLEEVAEQISTIEVRPSEALNPRAWETLQRAQKDLSQALADNADAPERDKAIASGVLARVALLMGDYQSGLARQARTEALKAADGVLQRASQVRAYAGWVAYYDKLLSAGDQDIENVRKTAQAEKADADKKISGLDTKLTGLNAEKKKHTDAKTKLMEEAGKLRIDSRLVAGKEGLDLLNQALDKENEVRLLDAEIARLEQDIELRQTERKDVSAVASAAEGKLSAVDEIVKSRKSRSDTSDQARQKVLASMAQTTEQAGALLERLAQAVDRARAAESAAESDAYDIAAGWLANAARGDDRAGKAAILSAQADALVRMAGLTTARLDFHKRCTQMVDEATKAWASLEPAREPPASLETLKGKVSAYLPDAQAARTAAADRYTGAIELYAQAAGYADRETKWRYQGHKASAHIGRYRLTGEDTDRDEAQKLLEEIVEGGAADSPYFRDIRSMQEIVKEG